MCPGLDKELVMKTRTHNIQSRTLRSFKITRSALIKLALAVALTSVSLAFLIRPVIGHGVGHASNQGVSNTTRARAFISSDAPVSLALTVAISDAASVVEGNPAPPVQRPHRPLW